MLHFPRRYTQGFGDIGLLLFIGFVSFLAYAAYAEKVASSKAEAMCQSLSPGAETSNLKERALADGAEKRMTQWTQQADGDSLSITYVGMSPFSRHICLVKSSNDRLVSANLSYLD